METESLRRSTRVRKPVKHYAAEQAEEDEIVLSAPPPKRKKKATAEDDDANTFENSKPAKKATKKTTTHDDVANRDEDSKPSKNNTNKTRVIKQVYATDEGPVVAEASSKPKPKRTATNSSWHADAAERRIAVRNRNVRQLAPGQTETRLKE